MRRKRESKNSGLLVHWPVIVFGSALVALISTLAYQASHSAPPSPGPDSGAVPVYHDRAGDAMPFPATLESASFKQTEVREAYQTAKEMPEVLAQQPCYCYCQREGHRSLLDCFKTEHAASCSICVKEALLAAQMHRQRKSAQEIRRAIIQGPWAGEGSSNQMIVTRAVQLQPNQKRGILMKTRRTIVNTIAFLTLSTMLMAAQMQMPASTPGTSKPAKSSAAPKTLTGTVSDSMCGAHHMEKDKSAAECTRECVKKGTKYALVVGKKVYTLDGHEAELDKFAGMKATVKGKASGETVAVQSVAPAMKMK